MAAAACSDSNEVVARTRDFPPVFPCRMLGQQLDQADDGPIGETHALPGGDVHVSAMPVRSDERPAGFRRPGPGSFVLEPT